jgi:hypothetical protein
MTAITRKARSFGRTHGYAVTGRTTSNSAIITIRLSTAQRPALPPGIGAGSADIQDEPPIWSSPGAVLQINGFLAKFFINPSPALAAARSDSPEKEGAAHEILTSERSNVLARLRLFAASTLTTAAQQSHSRRDGQIGHWHRNKSQQSRDVKRCDEKLQL